MEEMTNEIQEFKTFSHDDVSKQLAEEKEKYLILEEKYKSEKEAFNAKIVEMAKNHAIDRAIIKANGKNPKAIKALLEMDKIFLKEDGTLEGLDLDALKESDDYLFTKIETRIEGTGFQAGNDWTTTKRNSNFVREAMGLE